jgi:tight adherence protein B
VKVLLVSWDPKTREMMRLAVGSVERQGAGPLEFLEEPNGESGVATAWRERPDVIVADEITYGADLETGMRNLYFRIGQDDLPLFVTAVAIQSSTGGNLGEILENLSAVIRQRFKMRRKVRALASEGRASAMILSSLPILMFIVIQIITPDFYASVWKEDLTKICLAGAAGWMLIGNLIMFRMVNFRI